MRDLEGARTAEPLDRPRANAMLRSVLAAVVVDYPNGRLTFEWKHGGVFDSLRMAEAVAPRGTRGARHIFSEDFREGVTRGCG